MGFDLDTDDQAAFAQLQQERQQRAVEAAKNLLLNVRAFQSMARKLGASYTLATEQDVSALTDEIGITELVFVKGK